MQTTNMSVACRSCYSISLCLQRVDLGTYPPIVIDHGSYKIRAGFAGELDPRASILNAVGWPAFADVSHDGREFYVGYDAELRRGVLNFTTPVRKGIVTRWDDVERVLEHTFSNELRVPSHEHAVLITEPVYTSNEQRSRMAELLFEKFRVSAIYLAQQPALALYGSGRTSGMVLDCGSESLQAIPVWRGQVLGYASGRIDLGGRSLVGYLARLMTESGYSFTSSSEMALLHSIQERYCFVAQNFDRELARAASSSQYDTKYMMPDGREVLLSSERFRATEPLFAPDMMGIDARGLPHLLLSTLMKCEVDARRALLEHVVLCGGTSCFQGLPERLSCELDALVPPGTQYSLVAPEGRDLAVWRGGSMLASSSSFSQIAISHQNYYESGPSVVCK
jgi:actin-related protein